MADAATVRGAWQWVVKAGTAILVAVGVTVALPAILNALIPVAASDVQLFDSGSGSDLWRRAAALSLRLATLIGAVACGLFISSISSNAMRALVATLPFLALMVTVFATVRNGIAALAWEVTGLNAILSDTSARNAWNETFEPTDANLYNRVKPWVQPVVVGGYSLILLTLGDFNHRSAGARLTARAA